ncbi:hypothetical protein QO004_004068 [Rhizobium mesoamericanum]|uniref:helicase n=1 Tax=Rhizobium mesoamericanum TaxID=1079800 RepID=UPI0027858E18|nr:helicase [Rhizobium mesoamericanum]MDQ0562263.1 hypothetical protein [Rhizobium mesoamericanum]
MRKLRPLPLRVAMIAPASQTFWGAIERELARSEGASHMSHDLSLAQFHAFQLSRDLMVPVTLFSFDGKYGVPPSDEIDADDDLETVHEYTPWH